MTQEDPTEPSASSGADSGESATFEEVDWDLIDLERRQFQPVELARMFIVGGLLIGLVIDLFFRMTGLVYTWVYAWLTGTPTREVTTPFFIPSAGPVDFPIVGTISGMTWLWVLTLVAMFFYGILPLYQNKRMTKYYWMEFRKNKAAVISLIYLIIIFLVGLVGSRITSRPRVDPRQDYQPPVWGSVRDFVPTRCVGEIEDGYCHGSWAHPLGTDTSGKDILIAVIHGMEISMQVGLISMLLIITIASLVGLAGAYYGGMVDEVLFRWVDIQLTFPTFFLYLLIYYLIGGGIFILILIFGLLGWGGVARIIRSEALQRREEAYVQAAKNAGAGAMWTMRRHLLPNVSNSVITAATLLIPGLILAEAALAFLGLGDPRVPSWGQLIADGRGDLDRAWWISTLPGVFLFLTILAFNFLGDAMRDALDPRNTGAAE